MPYASVGQTPLGSRIHPVFLDAHAARRYDSPRPCVRPILTGKGTRKSKRSRVLAIYHRHRANVPPVVTRCSLEGYGPVVEESPGQQADNDDPTGQARAPPCEGRRHPNVARGSTVSKGGT